MQGKLTIDNLEVFAFHGCMEEEAKIGTRFTVNAVVYYNIAAAAASDEIEEAVDYGALSELIKKEVMQRNKLIETVALRIINKIKQVSKLIENVEIQLIKHKPPINANVQSVSITLKG